MSLQSSVVNLKKGQRIEAVFTKGNAKLTLEADVFVTFINDVVLDYDGLSDDGVQFWLFTQLGGLHPDLQSVRLTVS